MFFEIAPVTNTLTWPLVLAMSWIRATVPELSIAGEVFGMQTTEVNPPRAAAAVPVAIVSFAAWPGSRKCTCKSINPGQTTRPLTSIRCTSAPAVAPAARADRDDFAILNEHIRDRIQSVCGIDDAAAGQKQRIHARRTYTGQPSVQP